jgi:hypothetical protein
METVQVSLDKRIVDEAMIYAHNKGVALSSMIEDYLSHITRKEKVVFNGVEIPDIVLNLLGAGEPVEEDDINGRKAFYSYLEEKYK